MIFSIFFRILEFNKAESFTYKEPSRQYKEYVYQIPCNSCDHFFIGQVGKALEKRLGQHKRCVRNAQVNSGIFVHVVKTIINWAGGKKRLF